jgi:hypothetical protein
MLTYHFHTFGEEQISHLIIYICLFVCIFFMQIYSFTPILMKFCTLDLQNKKKITVYFNFTKTNPYYHFNPVKKKNSFSSWKYPHLRRFTPISSSEYIVTFAAYTHKKQPLLYFKPSRRLERGRSRCLFGCKVAFRMVRCRWRE